MSITVAIVQARLSSTRLHGKVLLNIMGKPMLWHVINRLKQSRHLNDVVIATTTKENDKAIIQLAKESMVKSYSGSEDDVLDRYYQAATRFKADTIVRITSDCPLIDPKVVDMVTEYFFAGNFDYVSNILKLTFPDGLDTEVFSYKTLKRAWEEARLESEREHVTPYIWKHPEIFNIGSFENDVDLSHFRWTVDVDKDIQFIREVYQRLYTEDRIFYMQDVLNLLQKHPELLEINKDHGRNEGYTKSLTEDRIIK